MSDLPHIKNGSAVRSMNYNGEPHCHYQRLVSQINAESSMHTQSALYRRLKIKW